MRIVNVERLDGKFKISFEDESVLETSEEDYLSLCLYEREEITREEIQALKTNEFVKKARIDAIKFVSYKIRSCREVRQKLEKQGFNEEVIEETLKSLIKDRYLDDLDYARRYARTKIKLSKISKKQLEMELSQRGIREDIISEVSELDEIDEYGDIRRILDKKYNADELMDPKKKLKAMKYLYSKGYGTELIQKAIDGVSSED